MFISYFNDPYLGIWVEWIKSLISTILVSSIAKFSASIFFTVEKKMTCMFLTKKFLRQIFLVIPGLSFWRLLFHYFKIVTVNCLTCIIAIELLLNSNKVYKNTKITEKKNRVHDLRNNVPIWKVTKNCFTTTTFLVKHICLIF